MAAKIKTAAEAREVYEKYYDVEYTYIMDPRDVEEEKTLILKDWEKQYTREELEELLEELVGEYSNFPLNGELDRLPNSSGFWQEAAGLGIPGVGLLGRYKPGLGRCVRGPWRGCARGLAGGISGTVSHSRPRRHGRVHKVDSEGALRFIEGARRR